MTEPLCIKQDGAWTVLAPAEGYTSPEGVYASQETLRIMPSKDREPLGVFVPEPAPASPEGKVETGRALTDENGRPAWSVTYADAPTPSAPVAPDNPTLGDWRVGLVLWKTSTGNRRDDLIEKIKALLASGHPLGPVADERVNYSNNVLRAELMLLKDAVGFTADDVEESLWRALRVSLGDLSGVWPLPEGEDPFARPAPQSAAA